MSAAVVEEECDWTGPDAGMSTPREGSGSSGGGSSLSAAAGGASSVGAAAALAKGARPPQALLSSKAPLPSDLSSQILESSILNNPMWSARQREVGAARQLPSARRSGGEGAGALGAARLPAASMPALPLASGVLRGARGPAVSVFAPLSLRGYGGGGGGGGGSGSAGAAAAGAAGGSSAGAVVALGGSGGAGGGGGGGSGSGGVSDGESGDSSEDGGSRAPPPISFAPGSPLDLALQAKVPERRKRLHRPAVVKRLAIGADEFKRRAEAKALGKIIDKKHSQYHVSYGMMLGIYCSVVGSSSEATATLGRLQLDDLMAVRKLVFAPGGSSLTPPHPLPRAFKFKDYAPNVFHSLRERFSIDQTAYLQSLGGACEYIEFSSNSKSGSFFFYSHDGKFMIKTQSKRESKFLRRILAHYYQHIMTNPLTYLTRFYGMHRIKMPHLSKTIYFVVMQSVFYGDVAMTRMYDIKVRVCV
jgi:1-phosphatidylinositol-4-phosphate 5-kinase